MRPSLMQLLTQLMIPNIDSSNMVKLIHNHTIYNNFEISEICLIYMHVGLAGHDDLFL